MFQLQINPFSYEVVDLKSPQNILIRCHNNEGKQQGNIQPSRQSAKNELEAPSCSWHC